MFNVSLLVFIVEAQHKTVSAKSVAGVYQSLKAHLMSLMHIRIP